MAEEVKYNSSYTGQQIDNAVGAGLAVRGTAGLIMSDGVGGISGATAGVDYVAGLTSAESALGALVNYTQFAGGFPISKLIVNIEPVQAGSGDPSPSNTRAISGWTGCTVSHSGVDTSNPDTLTYSWQATAGTVYYGTLNVLTGVLTVTHAALNMGSVTWTYWTDNTYPIFRYSISNRKVASSGLTTLCSSYKWFGISSLADLSAMPDKYYGFQGTNTWIAVRDTAYSDADAFKTAVNGQYIIYPLGTALTYQLTANQVVSLIGENNIWTNVGTVSVSFGDDIKNYIDSVVLGAIGGSY